VLRNNGRSWWQRLVEGSAVPSYVPVRPASDRLCPECATGYAPQDRYCPGCHSAVPEWRFG
jgi:hypothetical protein